MTDAVVFNGLNSLDFFDVRKNVCRIPEVVQRIRQAQEYVDHQTEMDFDFLNFISSDDRTFLNNIRFKSLAACVVQIGLFDRYLRYQKEPEFLVGNINGDSALQVSCGVMSFESMMKKSAAFGAEVAAPKPGEIVALQTGNDPVLSGFSISEYAVFRRASKEQVVAGASPYAKVETDQMSVIKLIHNLVDEHSLDQVVNIGPGNLLVSRNAEDLILDQIAILESIDLDPMLNWFWPSLKASQVQAS